MTAPMEGVTLAINVLVAAIAALPASYFRYNTVLEPVQRGFFCNDASLAYGYHDSTISSTLLYLVGFSVPFATILIGEFVRRRNSGVCKNACQNNLEIANLVVGYVAGAAATNTVSIALKYLVGRLRPHFFDVCRPDFTQIDCGTPMRPNYVTDAHCQGNPDLFSEDELSEFTWNESEMAARVRETRLSFVSGHASFSFQAMVFTVLYLQAFRNEITRNQDGEKNTAKENESAENVEKNTHEKESCASVAFTAVIGRSLFIPLIQAVCLGLCSYTSITRVTDNKHHPSDVIAGAILGSVIQTLNVVSVMRLFERKGVTPKSTTLSVRPKKGEGGESSETQPLEEASKRPDGRL